MSERDAEPTQSLTLTAPEAILAFSKGLGPAFVSTGAAQQMGGGTTTQEPSAAVAAMVEACEAGQRATAIVDRSELGACLDGIARAARVGVAGLIVVLSTEAEAPRQAAGTGAAVLGLAAAMVVSRTAQGAVDLGLCIRRASEDAELPFVHWVDVPPGVPETVTMPSHPVRFLGNPRQAGDRATSVVQERAPFALASSLRAGSDWLGRPVHPVDRFEVQDAELMLFASGAGARTALDLVREERAAGRRLGAIETVALSPFFGSEVVKSMSRAKAIVAIEPFDDPLASGGPLATALKAAFADAMTWAPSYPGVGGMPPIISVLPPGNAPVPRETLVHVLGEIRRGDRVARKIRASAAT